MYVCYYVTYTEANFIVVFVTVNYGTHNIEMESEKLRIWQYFVGLTCGNEKS
jgi:hypothetical protein